MDGNIRRVYVADWGSKKNRHLLYRGLLLSVDIETDLREREWQNDWVPHRAKRVGCVEGKAPKISLQDSLSMWKLHCYLFSRAKGKKQRGKISIEKLSQCFVVWNTPVWQSNITIQPTIPFTKLWSDIPNCSSKQVITFCILAYLLIVIMDVVP